MLHDSKDPILVNFPENIIPAYYFISILFIWIINTEQLDLERNLIKETENLNHWSLKRVLEIST